MKCKTFPNRSESAVIKVIHLLVDCTNKEIKSKLLNLFLSIIFIMKETTERVIKVGFSKSPKKIFDEIELVSAQLIREGWRVKDTCLEDGLGKIHLFFERNVNENE